MLSRVALFLTFRSEQKSVCLSLVPSGALKERPVAFLTQKHFTQLTVFGVPGVVISSRRSLGARLPRG